MSQFFHFIGTKCGLLAFLEFSYPFPMLVINSGFFRVETHFFCPFWPVLGLFSPVGKIEIRIGAQKRVWSAGIGDVSIFPFVMDQMRTFGIFGIFRPIPDVGDQFGFSRSKNTCFQYFSASAKSCRSAVARNTHRNFVKMQSAFWNEDCGPKGPFRVRF